MKHRRADSLLAALLFVLVAPAEAQEADEGWQVTVTPYLLGAAMSGTTTLRGHEVEIDLSASDIFSNLEFGAMAAVVARRGNWGLGGDAIWMSLGATSERGLATVDFDQGAFAFYGLYRLGAAADLTFGARYNLLRGRVAFHGPGQTTVDQDKSWVDPLIGTILRTTGDGPVGFRLYAEIGGFGVGSDMAWQAFPMVSIRLADWASLEAGYRWLDMDYTDGEGTDRFGYDMLTQGPVAGVAFRF